MTELASEILTEEPILAEKPIAWADVKSRFWVCNICKLCMRTPKVLPCLHTFCLECLENYLEQKNAVSAGRFKCPICKCQAVLPQKGVMAFANNVYIEQLQQSNRRVIDKFGDRSVEGCSCHLCSEYRRIKDLVAEKESTEKERLLASEKNDADTKSDVPRQYLIQDCSYHAGEVVLYFCVDCQQAACRICVELRHRDHRFEPLALAAENAKSLLKTTQEVLLVRQQSNSKFLAKLGTYGEDLKSSKEKALKDVDTCIKHMHEILDRVKDRLIGDVERLYTSEHGAISQLTEELELSQQQLHGVSGFLEAHKGHDPAELVQQRFLITDRINQLYAAEQRANFPLQIAFNPAISGMLTDGNWLYRVEVALKNSVGSIVSNRVLANDFLRNQTSTRGEVNKAVMLAAYSLTVPPHSSHETIMLAQRESSSRRQSFVNRSQGLASQSPSTEIALTRHLLPSVSIDQFGYIFSLDRQAGTVARFFGGCDIPRRVYHFPSDRCRPLRICSVGVTGGFAYVDAFAPSPSAQAFSLRFVPRTGDRFDLILPLDRSLFSGNDAQVALPEKIPAICADQNSNIYILDIDGDGHAVIIAYSMSFGSVRRILLETKHGASDQRVGGVQTKSPNRRYSVVQPPSVSRRATGLGETLEVDEAPKEEQVQPSPIKGVVSADFGSYLACCPHCTGTREVVTSSAPSNCPGIFAVVDTLRNSVKLYDIFGGLICELSVPSPLEKLHLPRGVAFDYQGNLVVCDQGNNRLLLFDHTGRRLRGVLAAGPPALEALRRPADVVAVPGRFQCYVAEETTTMIKLFDYSSLVAPHK